MQIWDSAREREMALNAILVDKTTWVSRNKDNYFISWQNDEDSIVVMEIEIKSCSLLALPTRKR